MILSYSYNREPQQRREETEGRAGETTTANQRAKATRRGRTQVEGGEREEAEREGRTQTGEASNERGKREGEGEEEYSI